MLPHILLAEDESEDVFLMRRALQKAGISNPLFVARDGQEAIDYLQFVDREKYPLPVLLLLDLSMPGLNGFDVLACIRARRKFKTLPVVVLTSSSREEDIRRATSLGASDYLTKPSNPDDLLGIVQNLQKRWLTP